MTEKNKVKIPRGIFLALFFLANPNIHIIDVLPDFISYIIIIRALSYASERAPYFAEARADFKKLLVLSILKIPALLIQTHVRSGNVGDNDILALFSFSFAAVELIWLIGAIKNLFNAFYYLGERSEHGVILKANPEELRALCIAFSVLKCMAYSLPELLLLTKGVDSGNAHTVFNVARLYPYSVVILVPLVLTLGIITAVKFKRYLCKIYDGGLFVSALDSLIGDEGREELRKKEWVRSMKSALTVFVTAAIFTLELRFDNFDGVNLLPRVIFGGLLIFGVYRITRHVDMKLYTLIPPAVYTAIALLHYIFETGYVTGYSYDMLATSSAARSQYVLTMIFSGVELATLIFVLVFIATLLVKFTKIHTGIEKSDARYSRLDCEYHRKMKTRVCTWAVIGSLGGVARLLNSVFRYFSKNTAVSVDDPEAIIPVTSLVTESMVPWFGTLVFVLAVLFIAYSFYLFSMIKDDTELKYL